MDVLSYHLVPKMEIIGEAEKIRVLKKYGIDENQLPRLRHNDPAVIALGAKPGDVIKIEREEITGRYNCYKIVVKG